jgi:exopolysaccharide production protein ExoY
MRDSIAKSGLNSPSRVLEEVSGLPPLGGSLKRAFDIAMAGMALLALMPIMLATAVLIRLLSADSVIFCERLIGRGGRTFVGYKFRIPATNVKSSSHWVERVAEALHASSLDQLPRLLNVIRGDMSLIGPRPRAAAEFGTYFALAPECLLARPGLISLWPNCNRNFSAQRTEIALDRYYVSNWSMALDFALLGKTILASRRDDRTA